MLCMYHLIEHAREEAIISPISQMAKMRQSEASLARPSFYIQSLVEMAFNSKVPRRKYDSAVSSILHSASIPSKALGARQPQCRLPPPRNLTRFQIHK